MKRKGRSAKLVSEAINHWRRYGIKTEDICYAMVFSQLFHGYGGTDAAEHMDTVSPGWREHLAEKNVYADA